jgi:hypothetical protein
MKSRNTKDPDRSSKLNAKSVENIRTSAFLTAMMVSIIVPLQQHR